MNIRESLEAVGRDYYPGSSVGNKVYQDISFLGYGHPSHRKNTVERAQHMAGHVDFTGKRVLDLGCSNGGLAMALVVNHGAAHVDGVDLDPQSIAVASAVSDEHQISADFHHLNLISDSFDDLLVANDYDMVLWLSQFMWLWRYEGWEVAVGLLQRVSDRVPTMLFETAQAPKDGAVGEEFTLDGRDGVIRFLRDHSSYTQFEDLGFVPGWSKRNVILATR